MYALSITSSWLVRKFPTSQVSYLSRYTYRELTNNSARVTTTSTFTKTFNEDGDQKRYLSLGSKNSSQKQFSLQLQNIVTQSKELFHNVKFSDLSNAPQPAFWYGVSGLIPFVFPPLSFLIFGYSPFLACTQLAYGATICSFLGGVKWGYTLDDKSPHKPTWENLTYAITPQCIAWLGLLLPQTLGFLLVSGGLVAAAYIDLTTANYPAWFRAMRLGLTVPAVFFLLLSALMSLFH